MKKSLIAMAVLLAFSVVGLGTAHAMVTASGNNVELTETTLKGDSAQAKGLELDFSVEMTRYLKWDTKWTMGQEPNTRLRYYNMGFERPNRQYYTISNQYMSNVSASGSFELPDPWFGDLNDPVMDVASRTEPGTTHREVVAFTDYHQFHHTQFELNLPGLMLGSDRIRETDPKYWTWADHFLTDLNSAFQFPAAENAKLSVETTLFEDGTLTDFEAHFISGEPSVFVIYSAVTEKDAFFIVECRDEDGNLSDYGSTPGGYAIYHLPCGKKELSIDDLTVVRTLDPEDQIIDFMVDGAERRLLLVTERDGAYMLRVLDAETAQELQSFIIDELSDSGESSYYGLAAVQEGLVVAHRAENGYILFVQNEQGDYAEALRGTLYLSDDLLPNWKQYMDNYVYAYDGAGRMAVTAYGNYAYDPRHGCDMLVSVYDASGLVYAGHITNSLDRRPYLDLDKHSLQHQFVYQGVSMHWDE